MDAFCPGTSSSAPGSGSFDDVLVEHLDPHKHGKQLEAAHPSTIFQLEKENGSHSAASLVEACMVQMTMQGIMGRYIFTSGIKVFVLSLLYKIFSR